MPNVSEGDLFNREHIRKMDIMVKVSGVDPVESKATLRM